MNEEPNNNKMSVEKIENGAILVRQGFSELRASNVDQLEALDAMNVAMYKLDQNISDIRKVFYGD